MKSVFHDSDLNVRRSGKVRVRVSAALQKCHIVPPKCHMIKCWHFGFFVIVIP